MEHEIPEIFQDLMDLLIETGKAEELEYFSNSIPDRKSTRLNSSHH